MILDTLLRGGTVVDGTGAAGFVADVGIQGERVVAVGNFPQATAGRVVDVSGKVVAPGFIDIHTHSDVSLLFTPGMESSLAQGVTAEVTGNCGISLGLALPSDAYLIERRHLVKSGVAHTWSDLSGFLQRVEETGTAIHVATLAAHGTIRKRVMGLAERLPDASERRQMQREVETAFDHGAIGLSSGLEYAPGMFADVGEMTALATVARERGGFYATHLRDEGDFLEEAVVEAIAVAEAAQIPLQLSHHKSERRRNWGKVLKTLALVDAAQARGVDILLDQYPYTAYQTSLATMCLPPWAVAATPNAQAEKLADPTLRARAYEAMAENGVDYAAIEIASCPAHPEWHGKSVAWLAEEAGKEVRDWTLRALSEGNLISAAHYALSEADVERVLADPRVMIGSDAVATAPTGILRHERPHPRSYGTFVRVLTRYVQERGILSLPEAIRRMTSLPAHRLGWRERGQLAVGNYADIVVFAPENLTENTTFAAPHALAGGIEQVWVNGTLAWQDGHPTGSRTGRVLRS